MSSANSRAQIHYLRGLYAEAMQEKIVAAALMLGKLTVSQPPPARHHTLLHALTDVHLNLRVGPRQQGFLTNTGRYVSREEALKIAIAAKQIAGPKYQPHQLFSEDLW